jgi:hypothetical protein
MKFFLTLVFVLILLASAATAHGRMETELGLFEYEPFSFLTLDDLAVEGEKHFRNIRQLTNGGEMPKRIFHRTANN